MKKQAYIWLVVNCGNLRVCFENPLFDSKEKIADDDVLIRIKVDDIYRVKMIHLEKKAANQ